MRRFLEKITLRFILLTNVVAVILLCASAWLMGSDPRTSIFIGFLPLLFPYFALINLVYFFSWLWVRPRWSILSLTALILCSSLLSSVMPFRSAPVFEMKADPESLRVMSWNIRFFTPFKSLYYDPALGSRFDHILEEVRRFNPDIVCFQEFTNSGSEEGSDPIEILRRKMGYKYLYFPGDDLNWNTVASGTAIFSKYPIVATENIRYDKYRYRDVEHTVAADILWRGDTIRVYSIHLKSFGFLPSDYHSFQKIRHTEDTGLQASKSLFRKMRQTFLDHAEQADMISERIANCRYRQIICMDMNNVAHSYAYNRMKGNRQDVFAVAGDGLGKTYISPSSRILGKLPTLRIDHIFADPMFEVVQMTTGRALLSDHQAVVADLQMAEKE
jgi:endonuclease/exonuclease/phosphatase family metal-dependent hydrolase